MMTNAPERFRLPDSNKQRNYLKNMARFAIKGDATPRPTQLARIAQGLREGDPLADAWVKRSRTLPPGEGTRMVDKALAEGIEHVTDAPEELLALFRQLDQIPVWLDPHLLKKGAEAFQRNTLVSILMLSNVSLMGGYSAAGVVKPLVMTGRLSERASGRLGETTRFTVDVTKPGEMQRFGRGFRAAVKVRLMHAMVRNMVAQSPDWDDAKWGLPINQTDMVGTNLIFSYIYIMGAKVFGCRFTQEETLGIMHLWRYVGYVMGVDMELLPGTVEEGKRVLYMISSTLDPADEDSVELAQALYAVPAKHAERQGPIGKLTAPLRMHLYTGITRLFMGNDVADEMQLPKTWGTQYLLPAVAPLNYALDTLRMRIPGMTALANRWGQRGYEYYASTYLRTYETDYKPVEKLKRRRGDEKTSELKVA